MLHNPYSIFAPPICSFFLSTNISRILYHFSNCLSYQPPARPSHLPRHGPSIYLSSLPPRPMVNAFPRSRMVSASLRPSCRSSGSAQGAREAVAAVKRLQWTICPSAPVETERERVLVASLFLVRGAPFVASLLLGAMPWSPVRSFLFLERPRWRQILRFFAGGSRGIRSVARKM